MKLPALLLSLLLSLAAAPAPAAPPQEGTPSHSLRITGAVKAPVELDLAALRDLSERESGPIDVVCASGAVLAQDNRYRGVRLVDVLDHVGLKLEDHRDGRRMVIVARATDDYTVTFSWSELYNTAIGNEVLVAWEKNGEPLEVREGQLLLISGQDIKTGPRHVRWLDRIEVIRM